MSFSCINIIIPRTFDLSYWAYYTSAYYPSIGFIKKLCLERLKQQRNKNLEGLNSVIQAAKRKARGYGKKHF
jgi:hypothetical protein